MINHFFMNQGFFDITIYQYGYEQCTPLHSFGPAIRNHYLFHFILSGKGKLRTTVANNNNEYHLHGGQGFLIEPDKIIHYMADDISPWEYIWIEFDGLKAKEYLIYAGLSHNSPIYSAKDKECGILVCQYLQYIIDHPDSPPPEIMGYMYLFLNSLIQGSQNAKSFAGNNVRDYYIQSTVSFIEEHYMEDISVEDMAAILNLNRSYFSKLFKKITQKSPQQFLIQYRINKSCELLRSTNMPISQVATLVGYPNQFHFTRAFKSLMILSPYDWRKQHSILIS